MNIFLFNWNEIILTKTNKYILLLFISKSENLLWNVYLIEKIWWDSNLIDRNLRVTISRLKKSLEIYWINKWIKNIRWEWYIFKK
jgi:DNA-binding response OmpR family regulator